MSYLCTFDGTKKLTPYSTSDHFKEGESYILERKDLEYETDISICQYSSLQDINTKYGRITCLYQNLYYTEYLNELPTQFNNHRISGETFPITMTGNMPNVFSFMRKDPMIRKCFPYSFYVLSDSEITGNIILWNTKLLKSVEVCWITISFWMMLQVTFLPFIV